MEEQQQAYSLRDLMAILFKHKYKILIPFVVIAIGTLVVARLWFSPKQYVARAVLMVKFGREFQSVSELPGQERPGINQEAIINTEMQILTSSDLAKKLLETAGAYNLYPDLAKSPAQGPALQEIASLQFRQNLFVKPVSRTNLIEVYYRHDNPVVAAKAVNQLVDLFQEKHLQVFSENKTPFLEEQEKAYQEKLKESENRLAGFRQRYEVYSLEQQKSLLITQRSAVDTQVKTEESRIKELQERYAYWKNSSNIVNDAVANGLRTQINTSEIKEQQLLQKYTETNRLVQEVRRDIQLAKEQLRKQEDDVRKVNLATIESELNPLLVKVASLKQQLAEVDAKIRFIDQREEQSHELRRDVADNESNYQIYLKKSEEARISEDLDRRKMTNIQIIERASVPLMPIQTDKKKVYGIGFFLAVAFPLGLAFVSEMLPQGLTIPHYAEKKLRLPVLIAIPLKK
ncbi:MAG TPA: Wzz/FepE/Etk N-terminal domain-containing protein [Syntrophorhabdales bacterium]|nr:Wzz/FepE/Etk N-terminal domain-containing protein [Syntrophorhabdales bacterium]